MSNKSVTFNYYNRDFESLKKDMMGYIKLNYPDSHNDFSENSPAMMLLELNAYVGDILAYHTDQKFNELFLDTAQNRDSIIRLAKNLGYNPTGKRPSVTMIDVSINIPTLGDGYDPDYLLTLGEGMRLASTGGKKFEIIEAVDFSEQKSLGGTNNRTIVPIYNSSNEIIKYKVTKRVAAVAGESKIATLEVEADSAIPYMTWKISEGDYDITEIRNIISKDDRFAPTSEVDWTEDGSYTVWYEVDSLPQERVFVDSDVDSGAEGYWKYTENRFIKEFDKNGDCFLTFGAGYGGYDNFDEYITNGLEGLNLATLLNNDSLGRIPTVGSYLHCRYRTGGGSAANAGQGTITKVDSFEVTNIPSVSVPAATLSEVTSSISVINPIPAIGGKDFPTENEIKHLASKHFSSQDRCVTADDYVSRVSLLPMNYGTVFRSFADTDAESRNTRLWILGLDENGKLKNSGNDQLKRNIASYLRNYKILNDFVIINDGTIINLGIEFVIQTTNNVNKKTTVGVCITALKDYFNIGKWHMNDVIYIAQVTELLRKQPGVLNVSSLKFYNKVGGTYSSDVYVAKNTKKSLIDRIKEDGGVVEIIPIQNKMRAPKSGMFEVKYPENDIRGAVIT